MKITINILLSALLLLAISCNNDDCDLPHTPEPIEPETCDKIVALNVPFITEMGCNYMFIEAEDTIKIHLSGIFDARSYGTSCQVTAGHAEVTVIAVLNNFLYGNKLIWPGCDGYREYQIENGALPYFPVENYTVKMMKMYPISESIETTPEHVSMYQVKLVITK